MCRWHEQHEVVPGRRSWARRAIWPGRIGRRGAERSSAWTRVFSSTHGTTVRSGGVEMETHEVSDLVDEKRIGGELEVLAPVAPGRFTASRNGTRAIQGGAGPTPPLSLAPHARHPGRCAGKAPRLSSGHMSGPGTGPVCDRPHPWMRS